MTKEDHDTYTKCVILTQYILNKGLKEFGKCGEETIVKELSSLQEMDTVIPMNAETLDKEQSVGVGTYCTHGGSNPDGN